MNASQRLPGRSATANVAVRRAAGVVRGADRAVNDVEDLVGVFAAVSDRLSYR